MKIIKLAEWVVAILLTVAVLTLLVARAQHAGGLWRDEAASVQVAVMPTVGELFKNFQRETFPASFYLLLRAFTAIFGTSDAAFRSFGFVVGIMLLVVAWTNSRLLNKEPPLISIILLGLNTTFLIWGTTVRGYGIGSVLILLTFALIAAVLREPTRPRIAAVLLAALASVQVLLYNSVILLAMGLAAMLVCLVRRKLTPGFAVVGIGILCAVSMLPYLGPFWNESLPTIVLRGDVDLAWFWSQLQLAFGNPSKLMTTLWMALFCAATIGAALRCWIIWSNKTSPEWLMLFFGLLVAAFSVIAYLAFLEIVGYATREWYYLALLAILAGTIDLLIATLSRFNSVRVARLVVASTALGVLPILDWPQVASRQTNIDLIARKLEESAQPRDLIVVNPWYYGVAFNWYYHGQTLWVTVPMMSDHRVHRFDLLKAKMSSQTAIDDLYDLIGGTLKAGDRVWFVGGVEFLPPEEAAPYLPPAPESDFGWNMDAYAELWSQQIGVFLRNHAAGGQLIRIPTEDPVNGLEKVDLLVIEGRPE